LEELLATFEEVNSLAELNDITDVSPDLFSLFANADDLFDEEHREKSIKSFEKYNPSYLDTFKEKIAKLRQLVLSPEEQEKLEKRLKAKNDLKSIVALLNTLKKETNISPDVHKELEAKYFRLAEAVGNLNHFSKTVQHKR
jgi:phosphoglycerate-specific signal transduction histidine kinase